MIIPHIPAKIKGFLKFFALLFCVFLLLDKLLAADGDVLEEIPKIYIKKLVKNGKIFEITFEI